MTAATYAPLPNLEFERLNSILLLYSPSAVTTPANSSHPSTILFCAWMGVTPRSRYLNSFFHHYHRLYPNARLLIILSKVTFFSYISAATRLVLHEPIVSAIESDPVPEGKRKILAHVMCNGGTLAFADTCQLYREKTGTKLSIQAVVFDSGPGEYNLPSAYHAASQTFPKGLLGYPWAIFMWLVLALGGRTSMGPRPRVEGCRLRLNDSNYLDERERRLYIYSNADRVVDWHSVEKHAADSRAKGLEASLVKWEGSAHVQHMFEDPDRYWDVISKFWVGEYITLDGLPKMLTIAVDQGKKNTSKL